MRKGISGIAAVVVGLSVSSGALAGQLPIRRSLSSLTKGSFYINRAKGDGVVQLTPCMPFTGKNLKEVKGAFYCSPDRGGFRCTSTKSLDVVFVFDSGPACNAGRKEMLESEEE